MKKYSSISVAILANSFFSIAEEMWAAAVTTDLQGRSLGFVMGERMRYVRLVRLCE
jgi:hypothetical protein